MPKRRPTRATLRGWWHSLPFLASAFGLMFLFSWLETERLANEYRAQDLLVAIKEVKKSSAKLREQRHQLKSMEQLEQKAPSLALIVAEPGQVIIIRGEAREAAWPSRSRTAASDEAAPTRSVVFHLLPSIHGEADTTLQHEVAKRQAQD